MSDSCSAACMRLVSWLTERGALVEGVEPAIVRDPIGHDHIGIKATKSIRPGDELLRIPRSLTLDVTFMIANGSTHLARRPQLAAHFPSREGALLLSGLLESSTDPFWRPYLETLPQEHLENPGLWYSMPGTFSRTIRAASTPSAEGVLGFTEEVATWPTPACCANSVCGETPS